MNCETRKVIIVIRDLPSLIAVNCAHDLSYGSSSNQALTLTSFSSSRIKKWSIVVCPIRFHNFKQ